MIRFNRPGYFTRRTLLKSGAAVSLAAVLGKYTGSAKVQAARIDIRKQIQYKWDSVRIGGGGYVTGMIIHPTEPNLIYIRTDVGGAYRWNASTESWIPIADDPNVGGVMESYSGVESIAVDPNDPNVVYMCVGIYRKQQFKAWDQWREGDPEPSMMFKSTDRGDTWTALNFTPSAGGNEPWRWVGERLQVDPQDGRIILFGSRSEGLWRSNDGGSTWKIEESLPVSDDPGAGVLWVLFDTSFHPSQGPTGTPTIIVYANVFDKGVYRSTHYGNIWGLLEGGDTPPTGSLTGRGAVSTDGTFYVTGSSGVWRYRVGAWKNISPRTDMGFNAISVDPRNAARVITVEERAGFQNRIFISENGGDDWKEVQVTRSWTVPWYPDEFWAAAVSSIHFDPHYPNRVWFTDWYNNWRTDDITQSPSVWTNYEKGHEELVVLTLLSPASGVSLFSGTADVMGFRHTDVTEYQPHYLITGAGLTQDTTGIDYAANDSDFMVAVGGRRDPHERRGGAGSYSTDNGETWTPFATRPPGAIHGKVAVSADGASILWIPADSMPYYSTDRGTTWTQGNGLMSGTVGVSWDHDHPLEADRVTPGRYYVLRAGSLSRSDDHGATWRTVGKLPLDKATVAKTRADSSSGDNNPNAAKGDLRVLQSVPGSAGQLWAQTDQGLYVCYDAGENWTQVANVSSTLLFAIGKRADGSDHPTLFVYGMVNGQFGMYRSIDGGATFDPLDTGEAPLFAARHMRGDHQIFGRVYFGTNGRGVWYGEPG